MRSLLPGHALLEVKHLTATSSAAQRPSVSRDGKGGRMGDPMVARVFSAAGVPDLVERLATGVSSGDLQAFLLRLARRRAAPSAA